MTETFRPETAEQVFAESDMIVKVKEPQPHECGQLRPEQLLFTYLHLAADRVRMEHAARDDDVMGKYVSSDSTSPYVRFSDYWGRWTKVGIHGDATTATREKGEAIFEAAVTGLVEFVGEWEAWPLPERSDQHEHPVQRQIRW